MTVRGLGTKDGREVPYAARAQAAKSLLLGSTNDALGVVPPAHPRTTIAWMGIAHVAYLNAVH